MDVSNLPEISVTRLMWREQLPALPRAIWHGMLRLLRIEPRVYLTINGRVAARFASQADHLDYLAWTAQIHGLTYGMGIDRGKEICAKSHPDTDAGDPGPS